MNCNQQQAFGNAAGIGTAQHRFALSQAPSPAFSQQSYNCNSFSHISSSNSLAADGSQFPAYQLVMGQDFPTQIAEGVSNMNDTVFPFEEDILFDNQVGDNSDVLARLEIDDFASGQPLASPDFSVGGSRQVIHSQPINIQPHQQSACCYPPSFSDFYSSDPAVQHFSPSVENCLQPLQLASHSDAIHSAPSCDISGRIQYGNCSDFGSTISSPGEMQYQTFQRPPISFPSSHLPTTNVNAEAQQQACFEFAQIENANDQNACRVAAAPASENLISTSSHRLQSSESVWNYHSDQSALINDGFADVFDDSNDNAPSHNYSNLERLNRESVAFDRRSISNSQIGNGSPTPYPIQMQREMKSASQASSYSSSTYSPMSVKQEDQIFFGSDQDQSRHVTEQEKADKKRIRNNEACRRSRRKRKMAKERTEAKVCELTDENMRLKEKIRDLETIVKVARGDVQRRFSQS